MLVVWPFLTLSVFQGQETESKLVRPNSPIVTKRGVQTTLSGDSWMYPYQRTPMGSPYISPFFVGIYGFFHPPNGLPSRGCGPFGAPKSHFCWWNRYVWYAGNHIHPSYTFTSHLRTDLVIEPKKSLHDTNSLGAWKIWKMAFNIESGRFLTRGVILIIFATCCYHSKLVGGFNPSEKY